MFSRVHQVYSLGEIMNTPIDKETVNSFYEKCQDLEKKMASILEELCVIDPIDNYPQYAELVFSYNQSANELEELLNRAKRDSIAFLKENIGDNLDENVDAIDLRKAVLDIAVEDITSEKINHAHNQEVYSKIKSEKDRKLKKYIIDVIRKNPGYVIAKKGYFYSNNEEVAEKLRALVAEKGFNSIKEGAFGVLYKQKISAIPAFMLQLLKKNIGNIDIHPSRIKGYPYMVEDSQIHFSKPLILSREEGECMVARKSKTAFILDSKDSKYDKLGTITISTNNGDYGQYGDIKIETTPRALAKLGLLYSDLGFEEYPYVITLPDILKRVYCISPNLVPRAIKNLFTKPAIPDNTSPDEERICL